MIRNVPASQSVAIRDTSLVRNDLLQAAMAALQSARELDEQAARYTDQNTAFVRERLDAHREILARRAANVALATIVTAEELNELRDAAKLLVAVRGRIARQLGLVGQKS